VLQPDDTTRVLGVEAAVPNSASDAQISAWLKGFCGDAP
jgi:hypothetical protein